MLPKFLSVKISKFTYLKSFNICLGAQKNGLIETVLLSTQNIIMLWLRNKKKIFLVTHSYLEACCTITVFEKRYTVIASQ